MEYHLGSSSGSTLNPYACFGPLIFNPTSGLECQTLAGILNRRSWLRLATLPWHPPWSKVSWDVLSWRALTPLPVLPYDTVKLKCTRGRGGGWKFLHAFPQTLRGLTLSGFFFFATEESFFLLWCENWRKRCGGVAFAFETVMPPPTPAPQPSTHPRMHGPGLIRRISITRMTWPLPSRTLERN